MSKQTIEKIFRGHSGCCNAPNYGPSTGFHMRSKTACSVTKRFLCPECHNKPDQSQEDLYRCCERPDNAFLCEYMRVSSQSKNTHTKRCYQYPLVYERDVFSQKATMEWKWHNSN